jgi:hypothetical protein
MWRGTLCCIVFGMVTDSGGQPTGTTEFITASTCQPPTKEFGTMTRARKMTLTQIKRREG